MEKGVLCCQRVGECFSHCLAGNSLWEKDQRHADRSQPTDQYTAESVWSLRVKQGQTGDPLLLLLVVQNGCVEMQDGYWVYSYGWIKWNFFLQSRRCFTHRFSSEQPSGFFLKEIINISLLDKIVTLLSSTQQEASRPPNVSATCFTHTFGHIRSRQHAQATLLVSGSLLW